MRRRAAEQVGLGSMMHGRGGQPERPREASFVAHERHRESPRLFGAQDLLCAHQRRLELEHDRIGSLGNDLPAKHVIGRRSRTEAKSQDVLPTHDEQPANRGRSVLEHGSRPLLRGVICPRRKHLEGAGVVGMREGLGLVAKGVGTDVNSIGAQRAPSTHPVTIASCPAGDRDDRRY